MGKDAIPTLYDASVSGYYSYEYQSGVGYGNNLYVNDIVESSGNITYPPGQYPDYYYWYPEVNTGYFYMYDECYYLFSDKVTVTGTPTGGRLELGTYTDRYPPYGAPIIVTLGSSEFDSDEPFGKTYDYSRTTTKYRKVTDLTDRKEYIVDDSGYHSTYQFTMGNMEFSIGATGTVGEWHRYIDCIPSDSTITVEFEGSSSGYYICESVDLSPVSTYESYNKFLVISDSDVIPSSISLVYVNKTVARPGDTIGIIAVVTDVNGIPVSGATVSFSDDLTMWSFTDTTKWDGTVYVPYNVLALSVTGIVIYAICGGISSEIYIPIGGTI